MPPENADNALAHGQSLTVVGYGQNSLVHKVPTWTGTREFAHVVFNNLTPDFLDAQSDYATGAPAGGDSGAPLFEDDSSNVILGMGSWGRMGGAGQLGRYQRVDTPAIRDWLLQYIQPKS